MKALIVLALVATSAPVFAAASVSENQAVEAQQQAQPQERRVCRRTEVVSGTRVARRRVCMTAAAWRARSDMSSDDVQDMLGVVAQPGDSMRTNGVTAAQPRAAGGPR